MNLPSDGRRARWPLVMLLLVVFARSAHAAGTTSFIRELAKSRPRVLIVTSGPQAAELGQSLQAAILGHAENRHKSEEIAVRSFEQAAEALRTAGDSTGNISTLVLVVRREVKGDLPSIVADRLPFRWADLPGNMTLLKSVMLSEASKGLAYNVGMVAPDRARLAKMLALFMDRSASDYRQLPFDEGYLTNSVAVFSAPEDEEAARDWGAVAARDARNDIRWYPLNARPTLTPGQLEDRAEAYLLDRSRKDSTLPAPAAALVAGVPLTGTTKLIKRGELPDGRPIVVFSAPNGTVLRAMVDRHRNFRALFDAPMTEEVRDLRPIGRTALVVSGADLTADERETIRLQVARLMRDVLKLPLLDAVPASLMETGRGDGDGTTAPQRSGAQYLWVYHILHSGGSTEYASDIAKIREDRARPYPEREPKPDDGVTEVGGGRADAIKRNRPAYERKHRKWEDARREWDLNEQANLSAQFERTVTESKAAHARGVLRLVKRNPQARAQDIDTAEVVWEKEVSGTVADGPRVYVKDSVTVRAGSTPSSLRPPANTTEVPAELRRDAILRAATAGVAELRGAALLPDAATPIEVAEAQPDAPPAEAKPATPPAGDKPVDAKPAEETPPAGTAPAIVYNGPKVAVVKEGVIIVKIDPAGGLRAGDRVEIGVKASPIPDPDDPTKMLGWDVQEKVTLRVTKVDGRTAVCVAAGTREAPKMGQIKVGMPVVKSYRPAAPKPPRR